VFQLWTSDQIRRTFLRFFEERGHTVVPSSSLVPVGDPTLLLTSAGMVQMKPYFLGEANPPNKRLASCQKCFRTTDIESVGNERNLTFFEMLGNFSVGDYFKEGAIAYAWELSTMHLRLPAERLWITVHPDDDEARRLWPKLTAVPAARIVALSDNWWGPAGETGPCGPDSELYFDRGADLGCGRPICAPGCDCPRFLEFWNLVFMQFFQDETGARQPLAQKHIDTGAGLERLAMLLQGRNSVYETDVFAPIVAKAGALAGVRYGGDDKLDFSLRVLADHGRGVTFLVGDGVLPSNEGRGYILRRVLRRAVRHGRLLGIDRPFLPELVNGVIDLMQGQYPELGLRREYIEKVVDLEESRFNQTLLTGLNALDEVIAGLRAKGQAEIPGEAVFRLYDTFGFPKELTAEVAGEQGLSVDWAGFERAMEAQRRRAQEAHQFSLTRRPPTEVYQRLSGAPATFVGYERLEVATEIGGLLAGGKIVPRAHAGDEAEVVLRETPFYPEAGGQVGDAGWLTAPNGRAEVLDAQRPLPNLIVHRARVTEGFLESGDIVTARVDARRRANTARHHTATHLLHRALREVLGAHVQQAGSLVAPDRLRFDFTHAASLTREQLRAVQRQVNERIMANLPVCPVETPYKEAIAGGAMALFGEKYGDVVRVVGIADYSRELCGGTHVERTGDIGLFIILGETGIGAGQRRIEALAGTPAEEYVVGREAVLDSLAARLQTRDVVARIDQLLDELQGLRRQLAHTQRAAVAGEVEALVLRAQEVDGVKVLAAAVTAPTVEAMLEMGDALRAQFGRSVVVLGAPIDGQPRFVALVNDAARVDAAQLVKEVAALAGGSGGGRADVARGGGRNVDLIGDALAIVLPFVRQRLRG